MTSYNISCEYRSFGREYCFLLQIIIWRWSSMYLPNVNIYLQDYKASTVPLSQCSNISFRHSFFSDSTIRIWSPDTLRQHFKRDTKYYGEFPHFVELKSQSHRSCRGRIWFSTSINPLWFEFLFFAAWRAVWFCFIRCCTSYTNLSLVSGDSARKTDPNLVFPTFPSVSYSFSLIPCCFSFLSFFLPFQAFIWSDWR